MFLRLYAPSYQPTGEESPTSPQEKKALPAHCAPRFFLKINSIFLLSTSIYCILYVLIGIPCGMPRNLWKSGGLGGPPGKRFFPEHPIFTRFYKVFTVFLRLHALFLIFCIFQPPSPFGLTNLPEKKSAPLPPASPPPVKGYAASGGAIEARRWRRTWRGTP